MPHLSTLSRPFLLLRETAGYFRESKIGYGRFLTLRVIMKLSRFIAFLLPFKALIFAISNKSYMLAGTSFTSTAISGLIMLLACLAFIVFTILSAFYNRGVTRLFDPQAAKSVLETNAEPTAARLEADAKDWLDQTTGFFSALMIGGLLLSGMIIVMPPAALVLLALVLYFTLLAHQLEKLESDDTMDFASFNSVASFIGIVAILIIIGAVAVGDSSVPVIAALFVFIAWRQVMGSVTEIAAALNRNRLVIAPRFLRKSIAQFEEKPFSVHKGVPPFLRTQTQAAWFETMLKAATGQAHTVIRSSWRHVGVRGADSFVLHTKQGRGRKSYLAVIYGRQTRNLYEQELTAHRVLGRLPLALPNVGHTHDGRNGTMLYDCVSIRNADVHFVRRNMARLLIEIWSHDVATNAPLTNHFGDFLAFINAEAIDVLAAIAGNTRQREAIAWFADAVHPLKRDVQALPSTLFFPALNKRTIMKTADGDPRLAYWGDLDIQPMGCQLSSIRGAEDIDLGPILVAVKEHRPGCDSVKVATVRAAAALYAIGQMFNRGNYDEANARILNLYTDAKPFGSQASQAT